MIRDQKYAFVLLATLLWLMPLFACTKQSISPTPDPTPIQPTHTPKPAANSTTIVHDPQEHLVVHSHKTFTDHSGALHIVGQVANRSSANYQALQATAIFYDQSGTEVARQEGPVYVDILLPGEKAPFKLSLWEPPPGIEAYGVAVNGSQTTENPFTAIEFVQDRAQGDKDSVTIVGLVRNAGSDAASQVRIAAVLYDEQDTLLNAGVTSAQLTVIGPDSESPFRLFVGDTRTNGLPARYELIAYSQRASDAELDAQAQVELVDTHHYRNDIDDLVIIGEVTNTGSNNAEFIHAYASFYDPQGQILAAVRGYVWADILPPGERSPFILELFGTPAEVDHWRIWVQGQRSTRQAAGPLTFESVENWVDEEGLATFSGTIRNDDTNALSWIQIAVTIYDPGGKILSTGWTVLADSLAPTAAAPFQFKAHAKGAADSFHLYAQGQIQGSKAD